MKKDLFLTGLFIISLFFVTAFSPPVFTPGDAKLASDIIYSVMSSSIDSQLYTKDGTLFLFCKSLGGSRYGVVPVNLTFENMIASLKNSELPSRIYMADSWGKFGEILVKGGWKGVGPSSLPAWFRILATGPQLLTKIRSITIIIFPMDILNHLPYQHIRT
jgi:hypothetical protein